MKFGLADHHCGKVKVLLKTDNICHPDAQQINKSDHNSSSSLGPFIPSSPGVDSYPNPLHLAAFETNTLMPWGHT